MAESKKNRRRQRRQTLAKLSRLESLALAVAQRRNRIGKNPIQNKEDLRRMKIPTASRTARVVLAVVGLTFWIGGIIAWQYEDPGAVIASVVFMIGGTIFVAIAAFGNRKTVETAFDRFGNGLSNQFINSIFDSLF